MGTLCPCAPRLAVFSPPRKDWARGSAGTKGRARECVVVVKYWVRARARSRARTADLGAALPVAAGREEGGGGVTLR